MSAFHLCRSRALFDFAPARSRTDGGNKAEGRAQGAKRRSASSLRAKKERARAANLRRDPELSSRRRNSRALCAGIFGSRNSRMLI